MTLQAPDGKENSIQVIEADGAVMTSTQRRFYASAQCDQARMALQQLADSPQYNTDSEYYRGSAVGFVDRHLYYLSTHPDMDLPGYLSNLRLMTNTKRR